MRSSNETHRSTHPLWLVAARRALPQVSGRLLGVDSWTKTFRCALAVVFGLVAVRPSFGQASLDTLAIRWRPVPTLPGSGPGPAPMVVEIEGLRRRVLESWEKSPPEISDWRRCFVVTVEDGRWLADRSLPPMAGAYSVDVEARVLRFKPSFPLSPGVTYRAEFRPGELPGRKPRNVPSLTSLFAVPPLATKPGTEVERIAPGASVVPENLLKFYLHFSAPMSRGHIYDHIRLDDESGNAVELPFLEIDEELWNPEMTRLTLFLDPGRIKRGVRPLEEVGPSLREGSRYTLTIRRDWHDANGQPLKSDFKKPFRVGPADREPPKPESWQIESPAAGAKSPMIVRFPEPMDDALARRVIAVSGPSREILRGKVELPDEERTWRFTPETEWGRGAHELRIGGTLEDLAGNNPGKRFEVDLLEEVQRRITHRQFTVPFEVK